MNQIIAKRLYTLMISKGWNQSELGRESGIPREVISDYMRGRALPTLEHAALLGTALDIAPHMLVLPPDQQ
jgi:transcriptional regulator with XRE-family HTH domain